MKLTRRTWLRIIKIALLAVTAVSGAVLIVNLVSPQRVIFALFLGGLAFTASLLGLISIWLEPDRIRASQSNAMLTLASDTFEAMSDAFEGAAEEVISDAGAQKICELMLPATSAVAVALTDRERILGYAGRDKDQNPVGSPIRTRPTRAVIEDGQMRVVRTQDEIGLPSSSAIHAAIVSPIAIGSDTVGTLKFYYPSARRLNETQESIAMGFAELLSTQAAARALEEQRKLATSMELKVLQSQINPHFLFNTINTIASFIRTDPDHARSLLREFAVFYRSTLENSSDLIPLQRELEQTERYLGFEIARFGSDRLQFATRVDSGAGQCLVPAFMVQPLVENAVRHAMPSTGTLHITCTASRLGEDLVVSVEDDGTGMDERDRERLFLKTPGEGLTVVGAGSETAGSEASGGAAEGGAAGGMGIAMRNIQERIRVYYGSDSGMTVESQVGEGTKIVLLLKGACAVARPMA